jgi:hypothetical protein
MAITPVLIADREPDAEHCDRLGRCWWGQPAFIRNGQHHSACWFYGENPDNDDTHWLQHDAIPLLIADDDEIDEPGDDWHTHPSLTAAERNTLTRV